jgi:putative acetyltransferase
MGQLRPSIASDVQFLVDTFVNEPEIISGFPMTTLAEIQDSCNIWMEMALKGMGLTMEVEGKVAGMITLYVPMYKKLAKTSLFSIVVSKAFRRQNMGTQLIHAIEKLGKEKYGLKIIHLEVYEKNEAAIKLYTKLGYAYVGCQEKFIKENGQFFSKILMEKRLSSN